MYRDILVATDGNAPGQRAAQHALGLGEALDADVHTLFVIPDGPIKRDKIRADVEGEATESVAEIKRMGDERGVAVTTQTESGDPCETIVDVAANRDVDLIVMGATSGGRIERLLHGSTTQCVSEKSSVPVLVIGAETEPIFEQSEDAEFRFYCDSCESKLTVSTETRDALEQRGCILCGATVTAEAFSSIEGGQA